MLALGPDTTADGCDSGQRRSTFGARPFVVAAATVAGAGLIAVNPLAPNWSRIQQRAVQLASSAATVEELVSSFGQLAGTGSGPGGSLGETLGGALPSAGTALFGPLGDLSSLSSPIDDPIDELTNVLTTAFNNIDALSQQLFADPFPILTQFLANQLGYAQVIAAGFQGAANGFAQLVTALPAALQTISDGLATGNVTGIVPALGELFVGGGEISSHPYFLC